MIRRQRLATERLYVAASEGFTEQCEQLLTLLLCHYSVSTLCEHVWGRGVRTRDNDVCRLCSLHAVIIIIRMI